MSDVDPKWGQASRTHDPRLLAGFRPRATDVLITTAPKCGTTWMQQILHQLRTGGDDQFASISEVVPWLELPNADEDVAQQLARYEALDEPRMFKTHCTAAQTPGLGTVRVVMTSRDPREACVSMFHHKRDMTDDARARHGHASPPTLDEHVDQWLAFGAWFRNVQSWWPERHRPELLWLRYEDLVADLPTAVDRLASFLEIRLSSTERARVLELSSFAWMRANADRFTRASASSTPTFKPGGFIRRGTSDGGAELPAVHANAIVARARAVLEPECAEFLGIVG